MDALDYLMIEDVFPLSKDIIFRKLYENSPIMFRTVDLNGIILLCNQQYSDKLGYPIHEIIGKSIFEHVAQQSESELRRIHDTWKKTGKIINEEVWFQKKDGTIFPTLFSVSNLYDEDGKHIGSNTTIQDISDIYEFKNEIRTLKKQRLEILGQLCTRIAHDFRNPIHIIKNTLELMEHKKNLDDDTLKHHRMIKNATSRLSHQIDDVLAYVTPPQLHPETHSISVILEKALSSMTIPETIILTLPKNDIHIHSDPNQFEVVFTNLILNAIQAMNNVGKIDIRISDKDDFVSIEVQDSGPGIPSELLSKIFDPLFTSRQIGTGLGLPSCKNIVENHGGTITVNTALGKGTTFSIRLPKGTTTRK
jgi:PAS domain S-box-containing protein